MCFKARRRGYKTFLRSAQLGMNICLQISMKMPPNVGTRNDGNVEKKTYSAKVN